MTRRTATPPPAEPRKRGAQPGNQNARTHGLYSKVMPLLRAARFALAREISVEDLTDEIAVIREQMAHVIDIQSGGVPDAEKFSSADYVDVVMQHVRVLCRAMATQFAMNTAAGDRRIEDAMTFLDADLRQMLAASTRPSKGDTHATD